jgi:hypothetical protein
MRSSVPLTCARSGTSRMALTAPTRSLVTEASRWITCMAVTSAGGAGAAAPAAAAPGASGDDVFEQPGSVSAAMHSVAPRHRFTPHRA